METMANACDVSTEDSGMELESQETVEVALQDGPSDSGTQECTGQADEKSEAEACDHEVPSVEGEPDQGVSEPQTRTDKRSVPWPPSEDIDDDPEIPIPFMGGDSESVSSGVMEISNSELERFGSSELMGTPDLENESWEDGSHHSWDLSTTSIGKEGERLAAAYLSQQGYEVVKTNEWFANNEVDIIAFDPTEQEYVLVEVKTRVDLGANECIPEIAVTREKQRRYRNAALMYLASRDLSHVRFDVIAINIVGERHARLRHLIGAYNFDY